MCNRHRPETQAVSNGAVPPAAGPVPAISGLGPNSLGAMEIGEGAAAKSDLGVPTRATILGKSGPPQSWPRPEPTPDPDVPPVRSRASRKGSKPPPPDGAVVIAEDAQITTTIPEPICVFGIDFASAMGSTGIWLPRPSWGSHGDNVFQRPGGTGAASILVWTEVQGDPEEATSRERGHPAGPVQLYGEVLSERDEGGKNSTMHRGSRVP